MSGETEKNVSGWTTDTLRDHLTSLLREMEVRLVSADVAADVRNEQRFIAQQQAIKDALTSQKEAVAAALVAAEKAVLVAETNAEKWRAAANEWRGAMNDRERNLMTRVEADARLNSLSEKQDTMVARMDVGDKVNAEALKMLTLSVEKAAGRREGLMIVFAIIAAIATVISVVMALRN